MTTLESLGWDQALETAFQAWAGKSDLQPGRILIEFNYICRVWCEGGAIDKDSSSWFTCLGKIPMSCRGAAQPPPQEPVRITASFGPQRSRNTGM